MAETSRIEWTDATWQPITGCSVVSPGCTNCYAMKLAGTRLQHHPSRAGLTRASKAGPVWTGEVRLNEGWLIEPLRWRRPRRIFVCAHGDLFHEAVPDEWIDSVFAVMALCPQHTFQVLTKRSARMRTYIANARIRHPGYREFAIGVDVSFAYRGEQHCWWPLPNVWLGISAEDQARADERIPDLLASQAAVRFVSAEPLLGPINLRALSLRLDWVIIGGESGPGARRFNIAWARALRDQCRGAGVACYVKQLGAKPYLEQGGRLDQALPGGGHIRIASYELETAIALRDRKGADPAEWPVDLRVREFPTAARVVLASDGEAQP